VQKAPNELENKEAALRSTLLLISTEIEALEEELSNETGKEENKTARLTK
jgi:hypothetical protein